VSHPTTIRASASNVFQNQEEYAAESAFDEDPHTRWATDGGTRTAWVARDFGQARTFAGVRIKEAFAGRVQRFEFQYKDGADWKTILTGTTIGEDFAPVFPPVTAREIRLNILEATEGPTIWEIQVQEKK
jgi:alpha-L-fucosidase